MPLIDRTGEISDVWTRLPAAEIGGASRALVPLDDVGLALGERVDGQEIGAETGNTLVVEEIDGQTLARLSLIAIAFPAFGDGRGFSLARQLRRAGFVGRLRAVGPLIADQFPYALACGFDEVELPRESFARQPAAQWKAALERLQTTYQPRADGDLSIFERRRAAREAGR
jgi:uncharacterized protein (DUF934 family)